MNYKKWKEKAVAFDERYSSNNAINRIPVLGNYLKQSLFERMNRATSFLNIIKPKKIIDLGCGVGRFAIQMANMGIEVYGYDISKDAIDIAKKKADSLGVSEKCYFFHADIKEVNFPKVDAWFDLGCLQYLEDPQVVISKLTHIEHCFSCLPRKGHWIGSARFIYRSVIKGMPYKTYSKAEIYALFESSKKLIIDEFRDSYYIVTQTV